MMSLTEEMVIARKFKIDKFHSGMRIFGVCDFWVGNSKDPLDGNFFSFGKNFILDTGFSTFLSIPANHESTNQIVKLKNIIKEGKPHKIIRGNNVSFADKYEGAYMKFVDGSKTSCIYGPYPFIVSESSHVNIGLLAMELMKMVGNPDQLIVGMQKDLGDGKYSEQFYGVSQLIIGNERFPTSDHKDEFVKFENFIIDKNELCHLVLPLNDPRTQRILQMKDVVKCRRPYYAFSFAKENSVIENYFGASIHFQNGDQVSPCSGFLFFSVSEDIEVPIIGLWIIELLFIDIWLLDKLAVIDISDDEVVVYMS